MSRIPRLAFSLMLALVALVGRPALAAATEWESVDVTLHSEGSRAVVLVSGTLPATSTPPADVELALPPGSEVQWAGEILGGPTGQDPSVTYTTATAGAVDVYRFRLTKSAVGQIEASVPWVPTSDGTSYAATAAWTPHRDVPSVRVSVRVPRDAKIAKAAEGAQLKPSDEAAYSYYTKSFANVKAGQEVSLSFSYTSQAPAPAPASAGPAAASGTDPLGGVLLVALAGIGITLGILAVRSRGRRPAETVGEEGEEAIPAPSGMTSRAKALAVVGMLGLVVVGAVTVTNASAQGWTDGVLRKDLGAPSACTVTEIPLTPAGDLKRDGGRIIESLRQLPAIGAVALYERDPRVEVEFCDSSTSAEAIRQVIASTGLVTAGSPVTRSLEGTAGAPSPAEASAAP